MKKEILIFILLFTISLVSCDKEDTESKKEETKKIGVTQIVEHPSLDATFEGFKKALEENGFKEGKNIEYDVQNAQNDQNNSQTIAKNFAGDNLDLILAISTPSAQHAFNAIKDIPIVFSAVTDPVGAELVEAFDKPGDNITGTSDTHPEAISKTVSFIMDEIKAKKVGIIYNSGEQNSLVQVEKVEELVKEAGGKLVKTTVANSSDVKQASESLIGKVDAIYMPTDNTVASGLEAIIEIAENNKIPLFASDVDSMKRGAVAASGFDYKDLGYETGLMAIPILKGEKTCSEINVEYPKNFNLIINKKAAKNQGIKIKEEWSDLGEFYEE
ncbi:MAG: ABC transporter substrate-binding protein [Clostridiales bacterium]